MKKYYIPASEDGEQFITQHGLTYFHTGSRDFFRVHLTDEQYTVLRLTQPELILTQSAVDDYFDRTRIQDQYYESMMQLQGAYNQQNMLAQSMRPNRIKGRFV